METSKEHATGAAGGVVIQVYKCIRQIGEKRPAGPRG